MIENINDIMSLFAILLIIASIIYFVLRSKTKDDSEDYYKEIL